MNNLLNYILIHQYGWSEILYSQFSPDDKPKGRFRSSKYTNGLDVQTTSTKPQSGRQKQEHEQHAHTQAPVY
jgi:hypothetical protein